MCMTMAWLRSSGGVSRPRHSCTTSVLLIASERRAEIAYRPSAMCTRAEHTRSPCPSALRHGPINQGRQCSMVARECIPSIRLAMCPVTNSSRTRPVTSLAPRRLMRLRPSCRRARLHLAGLAEERADLSGNPLEFVHLAVGSDEVLEQGAALGAFLLQTPTLARGCLTRFLLGALARLTRLLLGELEGTGFRRRLFQTLALFLGLAGGFGLQPAALGGEPLLLRLAQLAGGLFPGELLGALTLEALARGALLGFLAGPGLALLFRGPGAALGLGDLAAHQVAAVGIDGPAAVLLAHPARRVHRRREGSLPRVAAAAGREQEEEDPRYVLLHGSPFRFLVASKRRIRAARLARCDTIPTGGAARTSAWIYTLKRKWITSPSRTA